MKATDSAEQVYEMRGQLSLKDGQAVPLSLSAGQRLLTPRLEPVMGWSGRESAELAQPLTFPADLLKQRATGTVFYACNLPACAPAKANETETLAKLIPAAGGKITRKSQAAFIAASLSGGQVDIIMSDGHPAPLRLRWICRPQSSKELLWRCFAQLRDSAWTPAGSDYEFDSGGYPIEPAGKVTVAFGGRTLSLSQLEGRLTCFPCKSGLVKITKLEADGWRKRELQSLWLYPDRGIRACFSDGAETLIATAAPTRPSSAAIAA